MKVLIPSPLRSYTASVGAVEASGATLQELLVNLDAQYPGIKFRMIDEQDAIRQHIRIFVDRKLVETLELSLQGSETIQIVCALSGG